MRYCEDEDCEEQARRRIRCFHCGLLVCPYCYHHIHRCEPGHDKKDCSDYLAFKEYGKEWIDRVRVRRLMQNA